MYDIKLFTNHRGALVTEASTLQFAPGSWPGQISVSDDNRVSRFWLYTHQSSSAVKVYRAQSDAIQDWRTVLIFND